MKKQNIRKIWAVVLTAAMTAALSACSGGEKSTSGDEAKDISGDGSGSTQGQATAEQELTIAFCQMGNYNTWRIAETEFMQNACAERGWNLIYTDAQSDTAKQVSDMEDVIAQNPDYILLAPRETTGFETVLELAEEKGIPVILVDRDTEGPYTSLVSADFHWEGEQCAVLLDDYFQGEECNIVVIEGTPGASSGVERGEGFSAYIEEKDNMNIIASQVGNFNRAEAQEAMENLIQAYGDQIDAVFGQDDDSAVGAIQALKAAGYKPGEDVVVVGVGGYQDAMKAIAAGEMLGTVECSPYFDKAFEAIEAMERGEEIPEYIQNDGRIFTADNVTDELIEAAW